MTALLLTIGPWGSLLTDRIYTPVGRVPKSHDNGMPGIAISRYLLMRVPEKPVRVTVTSPVTVTGGKMRR